MRKAVLSMTFVANALLSRESLAQNLVWSEVNATVRGCATSISVSADNVPWVIGCGSNADNGIFYLSSPSCSPNCFNPQPTWLGVPTGAAKQVFVQLSGEPWVVNSAGRIYYGSTGGIDEPPSNIATESEIGGWTQVNTNPSTCISAIAPPLDTDVVVFNHDHTVGGPGEATNLLYGLGCGTLDSHGDHSINSWNIDLQVSGSAVTYNASAPWERLGTSQSAAAVQVVLFNGPAGPSNPQTLWVRDGWGSLWQYSGGQFVQPGGTNGVGEAGWSVSYLTDHYVLATGNIAGFTFGEIFQWNDQQQAWTEYMSASTSENTNIVQIASAQSVQDLAGVTIGPSNLWGIDTAGHIFYATESTMPK